MFSTRLNPSLTAASPALTTETSASPGEASVVRHDHRWLAYAIATALMPYALAAALLLLV